MLFWMSSYMSLWSNILFNCAVLINLIVAFFYPFVDSVPSKFLIGSGWVLDYLSICNERYVSVFFRTRLSSVSFNLDCYACICRHRYYLAKGVWYTYISRINDIATDLFCRPRTDVMVTWFCYGKNIKPRATYYNKYYIYIVLFIFKYIIFGLQIMLKVVHLISIIGNQGTLTRNVEQIITNIELLYHLSYLIFCVLGIFMHPFFYSVLVSITK